MNAKVSSLPLEKTLTQKIVSMAKAYASLMELTPIDFEVAHIAMLCGITNDALRRHLYANYTSGVDYFQKRKNGKIVIARPCALKIKEHYAK